MTVTVTVTVSVTLSRSRGHKVTVSDYFCDNIGFFFSLLGLTHLFSRVAPQGFSGIHHGHGHGHGHGQGHGHGHGHGIFILATHPEGILHKLLQQRYRDSVSGANM